MFSLSTEPLDPLALRASVRNVQAGGFASFEGWIRNHNEGRAVERLEYEAYEAVCITEGNAIIADARERFGVLEARCVHRVGALDLEDMAVWVGVSAAHRGEAFDACRYIIDAVKHRLPIWKKEHYTSGDSGWVNCERCAQAGAHVHVHAHAHAHAHAETPTVTEADYYARQMSLKEIGATGQARLRDARVLIVGAGGLGSPVALYLAAAGVGHIGLCENDTLEASNLHRQVLFSASGVGVSKAEQARERLAALNPLIAITLHPERLRADNVERIIADYDTLVDGTDNFETKFLLNDAAVLHGKTLVQASIYQYEGQLFVYDPAGGGPCLRCLWPEMPVPGCVGSCAEAGVLGAVPGVFGSLQAMEVLKHLLDLPGKLQGDTFFMDLLSLQCRKVRALRAPDCPVCSPRATISAITPEAPVEVEPAGLGATLPAYTLIDIRESVEIATPLPGAALALPASEFALHSAAISLPEPWVLCCTRGMRSKYLAMALRRAGHREVYSLKGGATALLRGKGRA